MYRFNAFNQKGNEVLNLAIKIAEEAKCSKVGIGCILYGMLAAEQNIAKNVLENVGLDKEQVADVIDRVYAKLFVQHQLTPDDFSPGAKAVIQKAFALSVRQRNYAGPDHLLIAMIMDRDQYVEDFLGFLDLDRETIARSFKEIMDKGDYDENNVEAAVGKTSNSCDEKYGKDLTAAARNGEIDPVIGRESEIKRVIQTLSRRTKNNPVLIGEPGVGKTAIVEGLALAIVNGKVPDILKNKKILVLDLAGMVAGSKYRGEFEERIKETIEKIKEDKNTILFIDELHTIIGAGSAEGSMDAANILKPSLARGELRVIGATTLNEYRKYIEKDAALERRFQPVIVSEPTRDESVAILIGLKDKYEAHHKVSINDEAIEAAVDLSIRYINDRFLPDKAIDLIDEAASKIRIDSIDTPPAIKEIQETISAVTKEKESAVNEQDFERAAKLRDNIKELDAKLKKETAKWKEKASEKRGTVTKETIAQIVSDWTGVPVVQLTKEESKRLLDLENILHKRVVGQNEAIDAISKAIRRGRVGLKDPKRPTGSFIFLGPTGVGKTELCKALSEAMFGDEKSMLRLDMSEYMEKHTVSKLIGSPPGYVGFEDGGQLTEKVRRKPYSVILFDEIEKAHPDVFNILLQILEDGRLTDSQGRTVDFKNTVIIMTSNVGARKITETNNTIGFSDSKDERETIKENIIKELNNVFRPEFLNRLDDIIVFNKLSKDEIKEITTKMLSVLSERLNGMNINITFSDSVVEKISDEGFDDKYGARPLRRAIQNKLEDKIAEKMLEEEIVPGDSVACDFDGEKFVFLKTNPN